MTDAQIEQFKAALRRAVIEARLHDEERCYQRERRAREAKLAAGLPKLSADQGEAETFFDRRFEARERRAHEYDQRGNW